MAEFDDSKDKKDEAQDEYPARTARLVNGSGENIRTPMAPVYAGPQKERAIMGTVYAGPQNDNIMMGLARAASDKDTGAPMLGIYAGPDMNIVTPMMTVYAGPDYFSGKITAIGMDQDWNFALPGYAPSAARDRSARSCPVCGAEALRGNFCTECGARLPQVKICPVCGAEVTGKFCPQCGAAAPKEDENV